MKTKLLLFTGLFLVGFSMPTEAQIFKKLGKKIEKKIEERMERKEREVDQKIDWKIDETMDEAEEGAEEAVLDWTRASQKNSPTDTDILTEATPTATSQNENVDLQITGSGPDFYLEYKLNTDTGQRQDLPAAMGEFEMRLKLYSSTGLKQSRSEVVTKIPMLGEMQITTLSNMEDPDHIIMINEKKKTYAIMDFSGDKDNNPQNYRIEVLGKEMIQGLNTTHVRLIAEAQEDFIFEMWTSRDIPGYQKMIDIYKKSGQMGDHKMWQKIVNADADGFVVRMEGRQHGVTTRLDLQNMQKAKLPNSLFEIPTTYKKKKSIGAGLF